MVSRLRSAAQLLYLGKSKVIGLQTNVKRISTEIHVQTFSERTAIENVVGEKY